MGVGSSRTRTLTLENDQHVSVIKVSQEVVDRIKSKEDKNEEVKQSFNANSMVPLDDSYLGPLAVPYFYDPRLILLQIQQEKENALKKNDEYWEQRVSDLEKQHGSMHHVMETEFQKAFNEINNNKNFDNEEPLKFLSPPCQSRKRAVLECYKKYPREPMRCSKEVEQFAECVDVQRATLVANRG